MKPEILLKAYVQYQSEDAFRELVGSTLDEVYSLALRIVQGPQHLAEETVLRVYWELARKAPRLGEEVVLSSWLREHTCKTAATVLREHDRFVDGPSLSREMQGMAAPHTVEAAPRGLATRVCQGILLKAARPKRFRFRPISWPAWPRWIRPKHIKYTCASAVCVLVMIFLWNGPFNRRSHRIIQAEPVQLTPASFAQLGRPGDEDAPATTNNVGETNAENKIYSKEQ